MFKTEQKKTGQWTISGIGTSKQNEILKAAEKENLSLPEYLEKILTRELSLRGACRDIKAVQDFKDVANVLKRFDKRIETLERRIN